VGTWSQEKSVMKILFIAGREPSYVRNAMFLKALEKTGAEIILCTDPTPTYSVRFLKVIRKFLFSSLPGTVQLLIPVDS